MVTDRSGRTIFDEAAACDAELVHHMLLECNVKPTEALSLAIRHGDTAVAKVRQSSFETSVIFNTPKLRFQGVPDNT